MEKVNLSEWHIVAVTLLVLVVVMLARSIKRRRDKAALALKNKPMNDWLAEFSAISNQLDDSERTEKLVALRPRPKGWDNCRSVVDADRVIVLARQALETARARQERDAEDAATAARLLGELRSQQPQQWLERFKDVIRLFSLRAHLAEEDLAGAAMVAGQVAKDRVADLLARAEAGDRQSFLTLVYFTMPQQYFFGYNADQYGSLTQGEKYAFPGNWDELVIRFYRSPSFGDFRNFKSEFEPGEVGLLAAEALSTSSLLIAQRVLALCNRRPEGSKGYVWREEIGDVLLADLYKLVYQLHEVRQDLVFATTDSAEAA